MTDIFTKLAALTAKDEASPVPACPFCGSLDGSERHDDGRFWWHCDACGATGPALTRYSEEDEACWESRPRETALIALVQEAAGEIERLAKALIANDCMIRDIRHRDARWHDDELVKRLLEANRQILNPQESANDHHTTG